MAATHPRTGEVDLRAALHRLVVRQINIVAFLEAGDPDWQIVDEAITELVRLRREMAEVEGCYHWRRNDCTPTDSE